MTDALALRAEKSPNRTAYIFLAEGEEEQDRLTYAALDAQARAIAAVLDRRFRPGERALLLYPPGLDFIAAFFGCLYAGVIAVPAYPPRSPRMIPRLLAILADAQPAVAMASAASLSRVRGWLERTTSRGELPWLSTDELEPAPAGWEPVPPGGDAVAFLQYTSGSTSTPKGVMVTHANLAHNLRLIQEACGHSRDSVFVSWLPPYHDLGLIGNLLQAVWVGAPCVLMAPVAFLQSPARWLRAISRYRGTTSGGPNFAYDLCVRRVPPAEIKRLDLSSWQVAFNGAEPVREETLTRFTEAFAPAGFRAGALYPCYGLAEATLMVSGGYPGAEPLVRELAGRRMVGCGRVLPDLEVAIVEPGSGTACPTGAVGEIWVAGDSVAQGYWNRPEETAESFGATLMDGPARWLRTGDLGVLDGGEMFIAGRLKDLIILRGRNHYPQDLEATAREAHPALAAGTGAAFSIDLETEERLVIVHEVERHAARPEEIAEAVRQAISRDHEALVYEVVLVPTGGVPRTTSGKVQRRACRDLYLRGELRVLGASRLSPGEAAASADAAATAAPPGSLEWLRQAFATAVRVDPSQIDPDRPLSASGLDSLAAVELKHAVEEATGVPLAIADLLEGMTLRELERQVAEGAPLPDAKLAAAAGGAAGEHPLSWNQHSLWFLHRLAPESPAYNIAGAARLHGADAALLGRAIQALVDRHPMLRATFADTPGGPVQRVAERAEAAFAVVDATGWSDEEVRRRLHEEAFRPFDLSAGPLLRTVLLRRGGEDFLVLALHHIAADFWSMTVLARELGALAAGETPPPPPAALYTDFARRQRQMLEGPAGERLGEHWRERLAGTPQLDLPTDRPRQPVQTLRGGARTAAPSPKRAEALHRLAAAHGCTPFVALFAAWQTVLGRWSGQETFLVGAPMAGRPSLAWSDVVGYFVNPVPLRADLSGDPAVRELMARARSTALDALTHQELPFALLTERLQPERDPSRPPLLAALLTFEKAPAPELAALAAFPVGVPGVRLDLGGVILESLPLDLPTAQLDLSLMAAELPDGLAVSLQWDADLFDAATVERMLGHLDHLLAGMADGAGQPVAELPLLATAERDQILLAWSGARSGPPADAGCLHELFEAQAVRTPEATALIDGEERWTYAALNRRANRLAHHLRRLGVGPEQRVGVLMGRSGELVAALLGVLKAGAAYVPLDPAYPAGWISHAAGDAGIALLLTEARFRGRLEGRREIEATDEALAQEPGENPAPLAGPGNLSYVMYTSGSTGRPKGVALEHRAPVERMCWARTAFPAEALAGVLASTSICFDLSVFEMFAPLSWGGTAILAENALALSALPAAGEVTLVNTVPSAMAELAESELPPRLRTVNLAGEALPPPLAERIYRHAQVEQVFNLYGPTEDATYSTWARVERGASRVTIGRPLPSTRAYVLDRHLAPVPGGVPGELFLAGAGGARGYLGRPDLTAERFIPDPFADIPGGRLYRTGDLARWLASGELEHLGRLDHQVKVRGFRIELEEIERVLREHPQVREAAVVVRESPASGRSLAAFVAPAEAGVPELRRHLDGRLPAYMVPSSFQLLPTLPRTLNGKIDRRALPAGAGVDKAFVASRTAVEEVLAGLWADVLGLERVGLHESFFDLGGHSLLAGRVASRLHAVFGVELPLRALFERPTVEKLAAAVEEARTGRAERGAPPLVPVPRDRDFPLSFAQERLWFLDRLEPGNPAYNLPLALRLRGPVSAPVLAAALAAVAARHEALRATFPEVAGRPAQEISSIPRFPLTLLDLSGLPPAARPAEAARQAVAEARNPFDLAAGPLCRAALLRLDEEEHLFVIDIHHIVFDGWSADVLLRDLGLLAIAAGTGDPPALPSLPVQYADFALWQRAWLEGGALAAQLEVWRRTLDGAPAALDLPLDRRRPPVQTFRGGAEPLTLPADLVRELRAVGRRGGATLFMTVLAGWSTVLHRTSGAQELLVGTPVANRRQPELGDLIGLFVNTLPLRIDLDGDPPFAELLGRVRAAALAAYENQDIPFERLVEGIGAGRDLARSPLFQVMLALNEGTPAALHLPGVAAEQVPLHNGTAKLELLLSLTGTDGGLAGGLEFNADLFEAATARRLADRLARLLAGAAAAPHLPIGDLPLFDEAEERQILTHWNATAAPFPRDLGLHELFEAQAARTPQATALVHGEHRVTYGELNARADHLARRLRALGVGPEVLAGVFCGRTPGMVAAALAVLKAGGAYLPLDPAYPAERLRFLLADSGAPVVLAEESVAGALPAFAGRLVLVDRDADTCGEEPPRGFLNPEQAAYAIYTSGSSGVPKGVLVRHRSAVNRITWALSAYRPEVLAGVLAATSLCFDLSVFEIFAPLAAGGAVLLADDALALPSLPAASAVTLVNTVPSAMAELVRAGALPRSVRVVNLAGEPLRRSLVERIYAQEGVEEVHNLYGPSEDTTYSTGARAERGDEREPAIGRPLPNTRAYVLDPGLRPVPVGTPGELWLGGEGLARGYLRRPDLTADRFRPAPFGPEPGSRLYRTGDLARRRADGTLDYLGRLDQQVKIRGFRIEPGEIESTLLAHPGVRQAAVEAREIAGSKALVAYVAGEEPRPAAAGLREHLRRRLPEHMIPAFFVALPELPLTPNGKVDRKALPAPEPRSTEEGRPAPRTPVEEVLAGIWVEVLGVERVGLHDSFFALGGHSLLATRVVSQLHDVFGVEIPLRALFERPSVAELSAAVEEIRGGGATRAAPPLVAVPRDRALPLSFAQERLWFLDRLEPGQAVYNIPLVLRLRGPVSASLLAAALAAVAERHEALRTTFSEVAGRPVREIASVPRFPLTVADLTGLPPNKRPAEAARQTVVEARSPFDLATGPLCRAALLRLEEEEHLFLLDVHHIVFDGWSRDIFLRELGLLYAGEPLAALPVQYADFALWQRTWLDGGALAVQLDAWRERLAGAPAALDLPVDRRHPPVQTFRGGAEPVTLPADLVRDLRAAGRRAGTTLFMTVLAGWAILLHRSTSAPELLVGTPVANRRRPELGNLIGLFVNTLPLRIDLGGDPPFAELLGRVRATALAAYENQDIPFERLLEAVGTGRDLARNPLFQVMLALTEGAPPSLRLPGVTAEEVPLHNGTARLELLLALTGEDGAFSGGLEFNADLFDAATARRLTGQLLRLLAGAAAGPHLRIGDLPLLDGAEEQQILVEWNDTAAELPSVCVHQRIAEQAARSPEEVAVVFEEERLTRAELEKRAARLAGRLRALGVGPEALVGIALDRSLDLLVATLGVWKAGGAYLPLDPGYPAERIGFMLADSGVRVVLTRERLAATLPEHGARVLCLDRETGIDMEPVHDGGAGPDHLAYVLYTSGSAGRPKGVQVTHGELANFLASMLREPGLAGSDVLLALTSLSFDIAGLELYLPLLAGARLEIASAELAADGARLAARVRESGVTALQATPATWRMLLEAGREEPGGFGRVRLALCGGEALPGDLAASLQLQAEAVWNLYGPTETTIWSAIFRVEGGAAGGAIIPIGRPIANTQIYVLDRRMAPVPPGAPGEAWIGGAGVARNYLGRPELTAERFVPDPVGVTPGARLYRTGDLARIRPDGTLEFLGRADHQVKIRGHRIELGEIEAALARHAAVREAVVTLRHDALVAYVVPAGEAAPGWGELRGFLRETLPEPMIPAAFVVLAALPLTPNKKVDRRALPVPEWPGSREGFAPPATPVEELLAELWAELLGLERVGAQDDFFALGGHSLKGVQLASRVRDRFGVTLPVRQLFAAPTVEGLARWLEGELVGGSRPVAPPVVPVSRKEPLPLSFAQRRLWFMDRWEPGSAAYVLPLALALDGPLLVPVLARSLSAVIERHEVLRTIFPEGEGEPEQVVLPAAAGWLPVVDLEGLPANVREPEAHRVARQEAGRPFDLERGPLVRFRLLRLGSSQHVLLGVMHHIVSDGWSLGVLLSEISALYEGMELAPLAVQYADYAVWQRARLAGEELERELSYWRRQLAGATPLELPVDRSRPSIRSSRGASLRFALPEELGAGAKRLALKRGATPFMVFLTAFHALLSRLSGQTDLTVGSPVAGRGRSELEGLIGCFINMLVLRAGFAESTTFEAALTSARGSVLEAHGHQEVPFERLVEELQPQRSLSHTPLFQVLLTYQESPLRCRCLGEASLLPVWVDRGAAQFDLTLDVVAQDEGYLAGLEYSTSLFDRTTMDRLAGQLERLLASAVERPERRVGDLPLLSEAERHQLFVEWNDSTGDVKEPELVHEMFERQAERSPGERALTFGRDSLTWRGLDARANRLAHWLVCQGVGPEARVGIQCERSPEMVVAMLAVHKAGGAYVPMDPSYPRERLALIREDAGISLVLTRRRLDELAGSLDREPEDNPPAAARPDNAAYVIYTSGSTGRPKGVVVTHRNAASFFAAMDRRLDAGERGVWLAVTSISFDISVLEILWTLCRGFEVVLQPEAPAVTAEPALPPPPAGTRDLEFSLFYFASATGEGEDSYRLLLEGARFADRHGFKAVWTPERHFHAFGGLYPNPAVTGAALAVATERVEIRAGSVVMPLQSPLRVAEEWAVVDRLSGGRVGISFASGWHADDFVLAPESYGRRKDVMIDGIETVRRLWRGEAVQLPNGAGREVPVRVHPRPLQGELPVWLTAAGNEETFRLAGHLKAGLLTHLLGQTVEELAAKVAVYRDAWREAGGEGEGHVTLMLHTFVGDSLEEVRESVRQPFRRYLRSSFGLLRNLAGSLGRDVDLEALTPDDEELLLDLGFDRYFATAGLFGDPDTCLRQLDRLRGAGVDEVACLIDFGVEVEATLASLERLHELKELSRAAPPALPEPEALLLEEQIPRHGVTHLQCTPSMARMLVSEPAGLAALGSLRQLLVGGEALPPALARQLREAVHGEVHNMYGPTETTVWSSTHRLDEVSETVPIGRPLLNTGLFILDRSFTPSPSGVPGELFIGGRGVARGYLGRPDLTAERFVPDPFSREPGSRLYATGDRARFRPDGVVEFLGRVDQQVKIRGHRVELGEIEAVLLEHPAVETAAVAVREERPGEPVLAAYVVPIRALRPLRPALPPEQAASWLAGHKRAILPNGMEIAVLGDFQAQALYQEVFQSRIYLRNGIELRDGDCVFDVGANIGSFTLFASQQARNLKIHAFEPIPPTFETLRVNLGLYGLKAELHNCGLSSRSEEAELTFYPSMPGLSGRYSEAERDMQATREVVLRQLRAQAGDSAAQSIEGEALETLLAEQFRSERHRCRLRTLSEVIREREVERIDLLKIDVERAEVDVLLGIEEDDWDKIGQIVMEVDGHDNLAAIVPLLERRGFQTVVEELHPDAEAAGRSEVFFAHLYARRQACGPAAAAAVPAELSATALRAFLRERLPAYMLPSHLVLLDALPLTPNGKVDRRALPAPEDAGPGTAAAYEPPGTEVQKTVAGIWSVVLQAERVGLHDNFFELGGTSLALVEVRSRLRETLGCEVSLVDLFRSPTVDSLARLLGNEAEARVSLEEVEDRGRQQGDALRQDTGAVQRRREFLSERRQRKGGKR